MAGYNNPRYCELENDVLRSRLADCKAGAAALVDAVERYLRQGCLRSELVSRMEDMKRTLK